jgi:hypothetical protein
MSFGETREYDVNYGGRHRMRLRLPPSPLLGDFLARYFVPYLTLTPATGDTGGLGAAPFATLDVRIGSPPEDAPSFAGAPSVDIDRSKGFLACTGLVVDRGDMRWVLLRPFDVVTRIRRSTCDVTLWGATDASLRIPALRLIEDLTVDEAEAGGAVFVHASAVVAGGRAVLAVGNKRAGKTTLLCRMLRGFAVEKLANDNCCLAVEPDGRVVAIGWPGFFKVDIATVAGTPELADDFPADSADLLGESAALWAKYQKIALFPGEGAERFGTVVTPRAPLGALILPRFRRDAPPRLHTAALPEVADEMPDYLQGSRNPNHPAWMGVERSAPGTAERNLARILDALAAADGVAVYRVDWAPSIDDLLSDIPPLRRLHKTIEQCRRASGRSGGWPPLPDPDRPHDAGR